MPKTMMVLAEKHPQEKDYVTALDGQVSHPNRFVDEVDNSKTLPQYPKILLSYLQGHAYELVDAKDYTPKWARWTLQTLPIFPKQFKYRMSKSFNGGRRHRDAINQAIDDSQGVIGASDPDFEGEWLLCGYLIHNHRLGKMVKRLWVGSLQPKALQRAFHHMKDPMETRPHAVASHARMSADWLIGINISRLITLIAAHYGYRGVYTAGRVQTPTVKLIADRRKARADFKPTTSYRLSFMDKNNMKFLASITDSDKALSEIKNSGLHLANGADKGKKAAFVSKDDVKKQVAQLQSAPIVTSAKSSKKKQTAPKLPKTNNMQGYLIKHAHISAKEAANNVLEPMYDRYNMQTYPRTECNMITKDDFNALKAKLPEYIPLYEKIIGKKLPKNLFTNLKPRRKYVDFTGKKVQKQGHGAIVPDTNTHITYAMYQKLSFPDKVSFKHCLSCTLAMFADDHVYQELQIKGKIGDLYTVSSSAKSSLPNPTDWKQLYPWMKNNDKTLNVNIDDYKEGQPLEPSADSKYSIGNPKGYYSEAETTSAPGPITEANLDMTIMPKYNLGTSSTRANIIDKLKAVKYIVPAKKSDKSKTLVKNEFIPTKKGLILLDLMKYSHLLDLSKVSHWENEMKSIADKKLSYDTFLSDIKAAITDDIKTMPKHQYHFTIKPSPKNRFKNIKIKKLDIKCPKCKKGVVQLLSMDFKAKNASDFKHIKFYGCSNRKCHFASTTYTCGLTITPDILAEIIAGKMKYRKFVSPRTHNAFNAKLIYSRGRIRYQMEPRKPDKVFDITCPKCKKGKISVISGVSKKTKKPYTIYVCTNAKCNFHQFNKVCGVTFTPDMIKQAIKGTLPTQNFTSRKGKSFQATMVYKPKQQGLSMKFTN